MTSELMIDNFFIYNYSFCAMLKKISKNCVLSKIHNLLSYYTIWGMFAHCLLPNSHFFLILKFQMAMQIACGGFYITYISPKYLKLPFWNIVLKEAPFSICDCISHYIPLLYYIMFHDLSYESKADFLIGYIPFLFYIFNMDFCSLYNVHVFDFVKLLFTYTVVSTFIGYLLFFQEN